MVFKVEDFQVLELFSKDFIFRLKKFCTENSIEFGTEVVVVSGEFIKDKYIEFTNGVILHIDIHYNEVKIYYLVDNVSEDMIEFEVYQGDIYIPSYTKWNDSDTRIESLSSEALVNFFKNFKEILRIKGGY